MTPKALHSSKFGWNPSFPPDPYSPHSWNGTIESLPSRRPTVNTMVYVSVIRDQRNVINIYRGKTLELPKTATAAMVSRRRPWMKVIRGLFGSRIRESIRVAKEWRDESRKPYDANG